MANVLKALPSRQLSLWKRRAQDRLRQKRHTRGKDYEAIGGEGSEDDDSADSHGATKGKFEQTEPLSVRLMRLRQRR